MSDPISAGIAAGASIFNGISQGIQNRKNREFQAAENQKARDFNLDMWNRNNAYNDPSQQMARLKNAGINPHLAYANGQTMNTSNAPASSNASSLPAGQAPQIDGLTIVSALKQMQKTDAEIRNIDQDTANKATQNEGQIILNGINSNTFSTQLETIAIEQNYKRSQTDVNKKSIEVSDQNIRESSQRITNLLTQDKVLNEQILNFQKQRELTDAQMTEITARIALVGAQISSLNAGTLLTQEKTRSERSYRSNLEADTRNKNEQYKMYSRQNFWGEKYDGTNAEYNMRQNAQTIENMKAQAARDIATKELSGSQKDINETRNMIDQLTAPAQVGEAYIDVLNPFSKGRGARTTTIFDSNGEYKGHSTTRPHK